MFFCLKANFKNLVSRSLEQQTFQNPEYNEIIEN